MRTVLVAITFFLLSCKKEEQSPQTDVFSEATYEVTITGKWKMPEFTVPAGVHYTAFTGAVHNGSAGIRLENKLASVGVEAVAETGNQSLLLTEVDSLVKGKFALAAINIPAPSATGNVNRTVSCNSNFSSVSFVSMIAPSPDWFVGVNNLALYRNRSWVSDTTIQLGVYDAGAEDGDVFGYANPPTVPQQPIRRLTPATAMVLANGNSSLAAIAQVRFVKL